MVLTNAQTTAFFDDADQMAIPAATRAQMVNDGAQAVEDLVEFNKEALKQVASNLRRPGGRVSDPNPGADPGATIPTPSFVFGAKSQLRLSAAADLLRYYEMVGRDTTPATFVGILSSRTFGNSGKHLLIGRMVGSLKSQKYPRLYQSSNGLKPLMTSSTGPLVSG